jgi:hypothetical protein
MPLERPMEEILFLPAREQFALHLVGGAVSR